MNSMLVFCGKLLLKLRTTIALIYPMAACQNGSAAMHISCTVAAAILSRQYFGTVFTMHLHTASNASGMLPVFSCPGATAGVVLVIENLYELAQ